MRLGVFGGTFDPVHMGHLIIAEAARDALKLDQVLFVPAGDPPHKGAVSPQEHRYQMVSNAIRGNRAFSVSRVDLDRPGPHYSADMLSIVKRAHPGSEVYFLLGSDSLIDLPTWRDPARMIAQARIGVFRRPSIPTVDIESLEAALPGITAATEWIDAPEVEISATELRSRVKSRQSIRYQVPDTVINYIESAGLYR